MPKKADSKNYSEQNVNIFSIDLDSVHIPFGSLGAIDAQSESSIVEIITIPKLDKLAFEIEDNVCLSIFGQLPNKD